MDFAFSFLLGALTTGDVAAVLMARLPRADPRYFGASYATAEVKGFISRARRALPTTGEYPGTSADRCMQRAATAYCEAGSWLHAADNDPELLTEERHEWRMNANVLCAFAQAMIFEADEWEKIYRATEEDRWTF